MRQIADIRHAELGFGRVLLAEGEHKRRPFKGNDNRKGRGSRLYCCEVNDGELFAFAGLWDRRKEPQRRMDGRAPF
jgi:hypothetical protein